MILLCCKGRRAGTTNIYTRIPFLYPQIMVSVACLNISPYFCNPPRGRNISLKSFSEIWCDSSVGRAMD